MKAKLCSSAFSATCIRTLRANFRRPISCSPQLSPPSSIKPQTPIFLRPLRFSASSSDLKKWHDWAKGVALSVGSSFSDLENGPDSALLCRELNWLMEDSIEDYSAKSEPDFQSNFVNLRLRASIDELYGLWKQRIEERRPFQYIVGCEHWRDLVLAVQEGVLIPRPETELIVDMVENAISSAGELKEGAWADLGTGSGAISIGIGRMLGSSGRVIASDLSPVAVAVASFNVQRYGLQGVIEVREGSWFEPLKDVEGKLAGVVSNPPYIPSDDISGLQAEVGKHEPILALDGGANGMKDLLHITNGAASMLKPGGFFAFETNGQQQCEFLIDYMENIIPTNFCNLNVMSDFAGIRRFVTGFRQ